MFKKYSFLLIFVSFFSVAHEPLGQITVEHVERAIPEKTNLIWKRFGMRWGTYAVTALVGAVVFKGFLNGSINLQYAQDSVQLQALRTENSKGFKGWLTSLPSFVGAHLQVAIPSFLSGKIMSIGWNALQKEYGDISHDESLAWYYDTHTNIKATMRDIQSHAVCLDLDSSYVALDGKQFENEVLLEMLGADVKDMLLARGLKAKRQLKADGAAEHGVQEQFAREAIVELARDLKQDMIGMLAFAIARYAPIMIDSQPIEYFINLTNEYLARLDALLAMSQEELEVMSYEQHGLFTETYEFVQSFERSLAYLNRSLKVRFG